ncbi:putative gustatory receptor 28a [Diachasma alloeum]|uniref:Gustatory receptor n=1 Tax=Diachasma alloeum TaxID=454923 RepID=A0A4E0RL62_9HYME|nr:putative gustatory receptor 28a [Diachasma alloeum]THK32869.1 gustatory receptor 32 [Diachasma alloeum]
MSSKHPYPKISLIMYEITHVISTLLGLAPCSIQISTLSTPESGFTFLFSYSRVKCFYHILLIALCIGIITRGVPRLNDVPYPNDSSIGKTIGLALAIMGNVIAAVIILYYLILQRNIIRIGNQVHEFDKIYGTKLNARSVNMGGISKTFITITLMIFIWIGVLVTESMLPQGIIYIVTSGLSEVFVSWLLLQYSLVIHVLEDRFRGLNDSLLATAAYPVVFTEDALFRRSVSSNSLIVENLIVIKHARNCVLKLSREVSGFYSFPVLLVIFYCCCCCVDTTYFYVMTVMRPGKDGDDNDLAGFIFCVLLNLYPIMILSTSVNRFHAETEQTAEIVYDLMESHGTNEDIELLLNNFAVELLHKKVSFNACGLFTLDCTLLHSIFAMIATYLLILVQFKPSG